jgi:hypothetical protein
MSFQTDVAAVQQWAGIIGGVLKGLSGTQSSTTGTAAKSTSSVTLGVDALPELTAGIQGATAIATLLSQHEAYLNTPAMVTASIAEKQQAFIDRINNDFADGNEADLENLESH